MGLALLVLALAAGGLRLAGGRSPSREVVEVPSRLDPLPPSTAPSASVPGTSPLPVDPSVAPTLDTTTPKIRFIDADGRFGVTVPRGWVNFPAAEPDTLQLRPFEQAADGSVAPSQFLFVVRWFDAQGCNLASCAAEHLIRLQVGRPSTVVNVTPEVVAGRPGFRFDSAVADQRLAGWLVAEGDRYWVMELIGPQEGFDEVLSVVEPVLATMSFG